MLQIIRKSNIRQIRTDIDHFERVTLRVIHLYFPMRSPESANRVVSSTGGNVYDFVGRELIIDLAGYTNYILVIPSQSTCAILQLYCRHVSVRARVHAGVVAWMH